MSLFRLTITLAPIATGGAAIALVALQKELSPRAKALLQFIMWIGAIATALGLVTVGPEVVDSFFDMQPRIKRVLEEFSTLSVQMQRAIIAGSLAALVFGIAYLVWTRPAWRPVVFAVLASISIAAATYYITDVLNAPDHLNAHTASPQEHVSEGRQHYWAGDYDAAIASYTKAVELGPTVDSYSGRAWAFVSIGKYENALADYTKVIQLQPSAYHYENRAEIFKKALRYDEAIADHTEAIKLDPTALQYLSRAYTLRDAKRYDEAIADFKKALHLNPNFTAVKPILEELEARVKQ